jgi:type IX secretion system PorP/SprF family membrane protein
MKKFSIIIALVFSGLGLHAQDRKHIANFSAFPQVNNPALTGYQGSMGKGFYRNQWSGFEDAPRTLFLSGEVNLADIKNKALFATEAAEAAAPQAGVQHAFGVSLLHDTFGPAKQTQAALNYSSGLRISEKFMLRAGAALTFGNTKFSNSNQYLNEEDDQGYHQLVGNINAQNRLGLNLGIALAAEDYFVGYGAQNLVGYYTQGSENLKGLDGLQHIAQAGYRKGFTDKLGLIVNGMYVYSPDFDQVIEGQLKAVYNNSFWVGAGYRHDLAYTFSAGIRLQQLQLGYSREVAMGKSNSIYKGGNEVTLSYSLAPVLTSVGSALSIW